MNKFKIPALIFGAVFIASAIALIIFIKNDVAVEPGTDVEAPGWVHKDGSSGKQPVSGKFARSGAGNKKKTTANKTSTEETKNRSNATTTSSAVSETPEKSTTESALSKAVDNIQKVIVTEVFFENLAIYIADSYQPAGSLPYNPKTGYSSASFKNINTYFGLNLRGLMPEAKSLDTARETIWAELLSSGTLNMLYETDSADLLDLVEEKGILAEKKFILEGGSYELRELTTKQRAEMFKASAQPLRHVASTLKAIAENRDLIQAMDGYFKAEKRVDIANGVFQSDLNQSRNSNSVTAKNKAKHSGKVLKDAIIVREKIKVGISDKIKAFCSGPCETPDDSFYIAKWVFRRVKDNDKRIESILSGCKLLNKLASRMEERAELVEKAI